MKLTFWKKDPLADLKLPDNIGQDQTFNGPTNPSGLQDELALQTPQEPRFDSFAGSPERVMPARNPYQRQEYRQDTYSGNRDVELVLAKLDALKATLDSINQRVANLERVAYGDDDRRRGW